MLSAALVEVLLLSVLVQQTRRLADGPGSQRKGNPTAGTDQQVAVPDGYLRKELSSEGKQEMLGLINPPTEPNIGD